MLPALIRGNEQKDILMPMSVGCFLTFNQTKPMPLQAKCAMGAREVKTELLCFHVQTQMA
jgi:hypothetical protein